MRHLSNIARDYKGNDVHTLILLKACYCMSSKEFLTKVRSKDAKVLYNLVCTK